MLPNDIACCLLSFQLQLETLVVETVDKTAEELGGPWTLNRRGWIDPAPSLLHIFLLLLLLTGIVVSLCKMVDPVRMPSKYCNDIDNWIILGILEDFASICPPTLRPLRLGINLRSNSVEKSPK